MMELEVKYLPRTHVICTKNGRLKENNTSNDAKGWQLHRGLKIPEALQGGLCIVGSVIFFPSQVCSIFMFLKEGWVENLQIGQAKALPAWRGDGICSFLSISLSQLCCSCSVLFLAFGQSLEEPWGECPRGCGRATYAGYNISRNPESYPLKSDPMTRSIQYIIGPVLC